MNWTLSFAGKGFADLRQELFGQAPSEAGAILRCHTAGSGRLVVAAARVASPLECRVQAPDRLEFEPTFLAREVKAAREANQSIVLVHTHPFDDEPEFSPVDDAGESRLIPAIHMRVPNGMHGALVLGRKGFQGRLYLRGAVLPIVSVRDIGSELNQWPKPGNFASDEDIFDRNVRAFGERGQSTLRQLRVGVVGVGGTGSVVVQQLAYLGVKELLLVDDDFIEWTNLNRVVGAGDGDLGRSKVDVARDHVTRIAGRRTVVEGLAASVIRESVALRLRECDFLFCCTDSHSSRAVVNQIAYQYLIPTIDMGVRLDARDEKIVAAAGRVQMLTPGNACLQCQSLLDPEAVRKELMTDAERAADPYIVGSQAPQPAVISINSTVASLAVTTFLAAVVGVPIAARRMNYRILEATVKPVASAPLSGCIVCSASRGALAKGDSWPLPVRRG